MAVVPLSIAGVNMGMHLPCRAADRLLRHYGNFVTGEPAVHFHVDIRAGRASPQRTFPTVYEDPDSVEIRVGSNLTLRVDRKTRHGNIIVADALDARGPDGLPVSLHTCIRAYVAHTLLSNGGLLLHAAGIVLKRNAAVFIGRSGAGKSTLSSMFRPSALLSDEIVAVTGDIPMAHSTPFSGSLGAQPQVHAVPLRRVFLLSQGRTSKTLPLSRPDALSLIMTCIAMPLGSPSLERNAFDSSIRLLSRMPCRRFVAALDPSSVRLLVTRALN